MFLGQLLIEPGKAKDYVENFGEEVDENAGLFQRATAYKLAVAKGKAKDLDEEIKGLTAWHDEKVAQLNSMGKPKGPGGVRDQLNVQSQILYTEQEISRKMDERDLIMATSEVYGPGALQVKYQGPETRRQVEMISKSDIAEGHINEAASMMRGYGKQGASMLLPGMEGLVGQKTMADIGRYGVATFTLGLSEVIPTFFGGGKKFSGEGVKGFITDAGRSFSDEQASVAMTNKLQQGVQAVYSSAIGNTPILTKVAPKNSATQIKNVGVSITPGSGQAGDVVQSKATYGGLLSGPPDAQHNDLVQALMVGSIAAFAVWFVFHK